MDDPAILHQSNDGIHIGNVVRSIRQYIDREAIIRRQRIAFDNIAHLAKAALGRDKQDETLKEIIRYSEESGRS